MGKRRENQKRACCYLQLLCAAAAAGERPSRSCASTWHFFGAGDGAPSGVGAPSGTGAGVASEYNLQSNFYRSRDGEASRNELW